MSYQGLLPGFQKPLKAHVVAYLNAFPGETDRLRSLSALILDTTDENSLFDRKNNIGHITASGMVLSPDKKRLLLLHHKFIKERLLQPGGHVDGEDENILAAAQREVREEIGVSSFSYIPYHIDYFLPIDIDTHDIPVNSKEKEPKHVHHDFRFLFCLDSEADLEPSRMVIAGGNLVWQSFDEAATQQTFKSVIEKIRIALSQEFLPRHFYQKVIKIASYPRRSASVVVTHILPDSRSYLEALSAVSFIQAVIPKPKSIVGEILASIKNQFNIVNLTREDISGGKKLFKILDQFKGEFTLYDIGGYFSLLANALAKRYKGRILGIIEDTENGYEKYRSIDADSPLLLPVVSVARSPLKDTEDFLVGQSVLFSADAIIRECGDLIQYMNCGVIGFGKIGRSIAHHLLLRGIKPSVYDSNPIRHIHARNQLCETPGREQILRESDVLFSATGKQALSTLEFRDLKAGCFVFSVTSSDDEFNTKFLDGDYRPDEIAPHVFRYSRTGHHFYLVNQGNAVNFLHKAVLGSFIHLVRAEMIFAGACLMRNEFKPGLNELKEEQRKIVAQAWLDVFNGGRKPSTQFEIKDKLV